MRSVVSLSVVAVLLALAPRAEALPGYGQTAALQVALRAHHLYRGDVDGLYGPQTRLAVRRFQLRRGLAVDGIAGPRTRRALGRLGRPRLGTRPLRTGMRGWDVAALQFLLARAGFPPGTIDGGHGPRTVRAIRRFQLWAGLAADGIAGAMTLRALGRPSPQSPIRLAWPVSAPLGDRFGFRGARLHAGLDFPAAHGQRVRSAGSGRVAVAGFDAGWGSFVIVEHVARVRTIYAHLSSIAVDSGDPVRAGTRLGAVRSSGSSTGPHLHFEVTVRGANVDPLVAIG